MAIATNVMANEVLSLNEMFMAPARSVTILQTSLK